MHHICAAQSDRMKCEASLEQATHRSVHAKRIKREKAHLNRALHTRCVRVPRPRICPQFRSDRYTTGPAVCISADRRLHQAARTGKKTTKHLNRALVISSRARGFSNCTSDISTHSHLASYTITDQAADIISGPFVHAAGTRSSASQLLS
jgi:hypothetical protein